MIVSYSFWGIHLCFSCCYTVFFLLPSSLFSLLSSFSLSSLFLWCFPVKSILLVVSRWWMKKTGKWVSRCVYKMYLIWIELLFMPPMLSFDRRRRRRRREFFLLLRNLFPLSCSLFDIFLILFFFFFASSLHLLFHILRVWLTSFSHLHHQVIHGRRNVFSTENFFSVVRKSLRLLCKFDKKETARDKERKDYSSLRIKLLPEK